MGCESFEMVRFDLGPLLQGQTGIAKLKSAYNSLIIGPRSLQCETNQVLSTCLLLKNAVYLLNYVSLPFPVDTSCI